MHLLRAIVTAWLTGGRCRREAGHGHGDVISRAADLFDRVHVLVTHNPGKTALLPTDERADLSRAALADAAVESGVLVDVLASGLPVDYYLLIGAETLVRSLRSSTDAA